MYVAEDLLYFFVWQQADAAIFYINVFYDYLWSNYAS